MKKLPQVTLVAAALAMVGIPGNVWASTVDDNDGISVVVDPVLSITNSLNNFNLVFNSTTGTTTNAISTSQILAYAVEGNNMTTAALTGALSIKISSTSPRIRLQAEPIGYAPDAGNDPGNAGLISVPGIAALGTTSVPLFDKPASAAPAGRVMKGVASVKVNGKAMGNLSTVDSFDTTLTATLKDA